jgi:hypothetical protein
MTDLRRPVFMLFTFSAVSSGLAAAGTKPKLASTAKYSRRRLDISLIDDADMKFCGIITVKKGIAVHCTMFIPFHNKHGDP